MIHHPSPFAMGNRGKRPLEIVLISRVLGSMDSHIKGRYSMGTWDSMDSLRRRWAEALGCIVERGTKKARNMMGKWWNINIKPQDFGDNKMMEHDDTPWEFGESWYYFKKRSDKVNLLIRCLMSPCFKIIQVAVCGPWCPLRLTPASTYLLPLKINIESRTVALECFGSSFPNCGSALFWVLHVRHVRCFWVYSNILALSLSLMTLFMHKRSLPRLPHSSNPMSSISATFCFESWVCTPWCSTCTKLRCWADDLQPNPPDKSVTWLAKMQSNPVV